MSVFSPRQTDTNTETLDRKRGSVSVEEEEVVVVMGGTITQLWLSIRLYSWPGLPHSSGLWRTQAGALPDCRSHFS